MLPCYILSQPRRTVRSFFVAGILHRCEVQTYLDTDADAGAIDKWMDAAAAAIDRWGVDVDVDVDMHGHGHGRVGRDRSMDGWSAKR